jgi:hypothetical protein
MHRYRKSPAAGVVKPGVLNGCFVALLAAYFCSWLGPVSSVWALSENISFSFRLSLSGKYQQGQGWSFPEASCNRSPYFARIGQCS